MGADTQPTRSWMGQPAEERVASRRSQLVDAGVELLGTLGAAGVTMRGACRLAELSPRYFYETFTDRDELVIAAFDRTVQRMTEVVVTALNADRAPEDVLLHAFDAAAGLVQREPGVGQILFREPFAGGPLSEHADTVLAEFLTATLGTLPFSAGLGTASSGANDHRLTALAGALAALFRQWTETAADSDRGAFASYCQRLVLQLLDAPQLPASPPPT